MKRDSTASKPSDWPANARECELENIWTAVSNFIDKPDHKTKEVLVSLVTSYDLNEKSMSGRMRATDYEVMLINSLYFYGLLIQLPSLRTRLYEIVGETTRLHNILQKMPEDLQIVDLTAYQHLVPPLKLYHYSYGSFNWEKKRSFADQIISEINSILSSNPSAEMLEEIVHAYVSMLNDLSYFTSTKRTKVWAFDRAELMKLFRFEAVLNAKVGASIIQRPLKGVMMTTISNYVLKSRNSYNEEYICKYVSQEVACSSIVNGQIWMRKTERLNDKREQRVIPELFAVKKWLQKDWAKNVDFSPTRTYYVSSFSKSMGSSSMQSEYGQCVYGYKNDRIAELIAPISMMTVAEDKYPQLAQVLAFDVLYDNDAAKKEINYICDIIDMFDLTSGEKTSFFEEIMQYWILSVKDKKWEQERERRYVVFLYPDYDYINADTSDNEYLKVKTSLFLMPDFVLGDNPSKWYIRQCVDNKRKAISVREYVWCEECFNRDFDKVLNDCSKCPVCGSMNIKIEVPHH